MLETMKCTLTCITGHGLLNQQEREAENRISANWMDSIFAFVDSNLLFEYIAQFPRASSDHPFLSKSKLSFCNKLWTELL